LLGSATPSLESWYAAQQGRYQLRTLTKRAVEDATLPLIRIVNLERERPSDGLSPRVIAAIASDWKLANNRCCS
jgi:primosomal protein N' (replication factor Y)